jgi:hypothetical protein
MSHCWAVIRNSNRPLAFVRVVLTFITMVLKSPKKKKPVLVYNHGSRICETKWKTLHHTGVNEFLTKCKWAMQNISPVQISFWAGKNENLMPMHSAWKKFCPLEHEGNIFYIKKRSQWNNTLFPPPPLQKKGYLNLATVVHLFQKIMCILLQRKIG